MNDMNDMNASYSQPDQTPPPQPAKGLAQAGFLCGLGSILCGSVPVGVAGLVLSGIAGKRGNSSALRKAGVICSVCGILLSAVLIALTVYGMITEAKWMPDILSDGLFGDDSISVSAPTVHKPETEGELSPSEMLAFTPNGTDTYEVFAPEGVTLPTEVVIPAHYNGGTVTAIASEGFQNQGQLKSVSIPDTVKVIGRGAFAGCSHLSELRFSSRLEAIGMQAFYNCDSLKKVTVPEGVTSIGYECFADCESLHTVVLPSSLTSLGEASFRGCVQLLPTFPLPPALTSLPMGVYDGCTFPTFELTDSITSIGMFAFNGATLNTVVYPGTMAEWDMISKDENWYIPNAAQPMTVVCVDGTITLAAE